MESPSDPRVGSPFASEPPPPLRNNAAACDGLQTKGSPGPSVDLEYAASALGDSDVVAIEPEALGEGVWGQTAAAAAYAAVILLAFVVLSWTFFPAGGVAVAALGAVVSLMGLSSSRNRLSMVTLSLHGMLFFACYWRAI